MKDKRKKGVWYAASVYTKSPGFGPDIEALEGHPITVKPNESIKDSLIRHGYNPKESRAELIYS